MLIKIATDIDDNGKITWTTLYAEAIRSRLVKIQNLKDVPDKKLARDNLGVTFSILEAEKEAIEISKNDNHRMMQMIYSMIISRVENNEDRISQLFENLGIWNYIGWDGTVLDNDTPFVDYTKQAFYQTYQDYQEADQKLDDKFTLEMKTFRDALTVANKANYDNLVRIITEWWAFFQENFETTTAKILADREVLNQEAIELLHDIEACYERVEENMDIIREDIFTVNARITKLRNVTDKAHTDLVKYLSCIIDTAVSYYEEKLGSALENILDTISDTYYTKTQINSMKNDYYTKSEIDALLEDLRNSLSDISNKIPKVWSSDGSRLQFYYKGTGTNIGTVGGGTDQIWISD